MSNSKLTKEGLKGFSISYNKAKSLGITDEDLKYIYEIGQDKYRISIRHEGGRVTKVVYGLLEAINKKWEILKSLKQNNDLCKNNDVNKCSDMTVRQGFDEFFKERLKLVASGDLELTTHEKNVVAFNGRHIRDSKLLDMKIVDVTDELAEEYVSALYATEKINGNDKLSINTIYNPFALMHLVFEFFKVNLKIIKSNPFNAVKKKPKYVPKDQNYLTTKEIKYVLKELVKKNIRFQLMINLILETGLRIEELVAIKFSDINYLRSTIKISRAVVKSKLTGKLIVKDVKTKDSEREITISAYTLELMDKYRTFKESCGWLIINDDYIFTAWEDNVLISPEKYTEEWREFIRELGFSNLPLRNLRHTSATFMLQGETNIKAVKKRFGWSKTSTVMNIYNQSNLDEDRKLMQKFEEEFRNSLGATYSELYRISVGRYNNRRKLRNIMQILLDKPIETTCFDDDLRRCQEYLFELFPIFSKIAQIDSKLDDEEIEAIFEGFKPLYKTIKIEPINDEIT